MPFLYPPRPERAIHPDALPMFNHMGWVANYKKNGTCTVIEYNATVGKLQCWTRHNEPHKVWTPDLHSPSLRKQGNYILVGELLHSKGVGHKDTMYLFDILEANGKSQVGRGYEERSDYLKLLWPSIGETKSHYLVDDRLWIAKLIRSNFSDLFSSLSENEDEGIVLKDPVSHLSPCFKEGANTGWQVKCRRPTKDFSF